MSKNVDVDLRIRAKNQASKTLDEINADVKQLAQAQKEQASTSVLASKATRDLIAQQNLLAASTRELTRRRGLAQAFADQRKEIGDTALKLRELSAQYKAMQASGKGGGTIIGFNDKDLKAVGREVITLGSALEKLVAKNKKAGDALEALGVDTKDLNSSMSLLESSVRESEAAYESSVGAIKRQSQAIEQNNAVQAEAARRNKEEAAALRARNAAGTQIAIGDKNRAGELAALRADIEARSAVARTTDVQAEAARRLAAELAVETAAQERSTAAVRAGAVAIAEQRARRADAIAAFTGEASAEQRSIQRKNQLVALLNTERGQKILNAEAQRRQTAELDKNTAAVGRNVAATRNAASAQGFFDDTGRKSLSTYQRIRGQILGLTAAYIGIYQVINTGQKAIAATTRNQALKVGLATINNGDAAAAASDYKFLADEAERLGLVFDDVAPQFANLAVSAKAVGINGETIRQVFTDVSTSAAAMNLSVEDTEGVFRAMVQIFSKGKVQAEELRGQLGDRLPGAVVKFAAANKIALTDLDKQLKDGTVGVDFLIQGIAAYADQYDSTLESVTTRLQAYINRATNAYNDFLRALLSGANDQKLKDAFERISLFFRSDEGAEFAGLLATAFGKVIDIFILLADNFEVVIKLVKAFIAVQVIKFLVDMASGFTAVIGKLITYTGLVTTANLQTGLLAGKARLLAFAFGPVGIAIGAVTSAVFLYIDGIKEATEETQRYMNILSDLTFARGVDDITAGISGAKKEIDDLNNTVNDLVKRRDDLNSLNPITAAKAQFDGNELVTREKLTEKINTAFARQKMLIESVEDGEIRLGRAAAERAQEEADAAKARAAAEAAAKPTGEKPDKPTKASGPTVADTERQQEDIARKARQEILDLQDDILKTQMQSNATTQSQLDENLRLQLARNQIAYEDQVEKNAKLAAQAANAAEEAGAKGRPAVDISAELTQLDALAQRRQAVADAAAREQATIDSIALREKAINDLIDLRNAKVALYAAQAEAGTISQGEAYAQTIAAQDTINAQITTATTDFLTFLATIPPDSDLYTKLGIEKVLLGLKQIQAEATKITATQQFFKNYQTQIAAGFSNTFSVMAKGLAGAIEGTNTLGEAFSAAGDAFANFAADFLTQIAEMIIQQLILYAIQVLTGTAKGGFSLSTALQGGYGKQHDGGIVGRHRSGTAHVSPLVFAGAGRFHEGGLPGLKANEVPTILEKGEEVLTEDDPRHVFNGGGASNQPDVNIFNTIDSASVVQQGIQSTGSQRAILNVVKANKNAFKQALGIKN